MAEQFDQMPTPPASATGPAVFAVLLQAAAYRFRWASDSLPDSLETFRPAPTSLSIGELLAHLCELAERLATSLGSPEAIAGSSSGKERSPMDGHRRRALDALASAIRTVQDMNVAALDALRLERPTGEPFEVWNLLHGPLADFLTHVGQVASWRRIAGSPAPAPRVFAGLPPYERSDTSEEAEAGEPIGPTTLTGRDSRIHDEDWTDSIFQDVTLTGARFDDVSLAGAKFDNVTFAGATLKNVDLTNVNITDANVDGLRLDGELLRPSS
ncbi:MAG: pentapeptide repeat-containing protein [Planctomycetota bacterium]